MRTALLALLTLVTASVDAQPEIHRCLQEDGTTAFQEMPCPEPVRDAEDSDTASDGQSDGETVVPADGLSDFVNPFDEPEAVSLPADAESEGPVSQNRAACEKTNRDAIDTIDFEMRKGYTKEQGERYLSELLVLTKQLRACKQL